MMKNFPAASHSLREESIFIYRTIVVSRQTYIIPLFTPAENRTYQLQKMSSPPRRTLPAFTTCDSDFPTFRPPSAQQLFLQDEEYGHALSALVKAVSDVIVVDASRNIFLGRRRVQPQPDWWFFGGRARFGERPEQAAARNLRRELGLVFHEDRFELLNVYSFRWSSREQKPRDHGTCDVSVVFALELREEEIGKLKLDGLEYSDGRWWTQDTSQESYPPLILSPPSSRESVESCGIKFTSSTSLWRVVGKGGWVVQMIGMGIKFPSAVLGGGIMGVIWGGVKLGRDKIPSP